MKKRVLSILTVILMMTCMLTFTGCGKDNTGVVGTWQLTGWEVNGSEQSLEDYGMQDVDSTMTFTEEGEVTIEMSEDKTSEGTWKLDDDTLEVTASGATQTGTLKDGKIYLGDDKNGYAIYEKK